MVPSARTGELLEALPWGEGLALASRWWAVTLCITCLIIIIIISYVIVFYFVFNYQTVFLSLQILLLILLPAPPEWGRREGGWVSLQRWISTWVWPIPCAPDPSLSPLPSVAQLRWAVACWALCHLQHRDEVRNLAWWAAGSCLAKPNQPWVCYILFTIISRFNASSTLKCVL